jgi:restriction system protein
MSVDKRMAERQRLLLQILVERGTSVHHDEVMSELEKRQPPIPEELESYPSAPGRTKYRVNTLFFNIGQVKAGWIVKNKGMWSATREGAEALKNYPDPVSFYSAEINAYREWKSLRDQTIDLASTDQLADLSPDAITAISVDEAEEQAATQIRDYLARQSWQSFQELVGYLLMAMGWHVVYTAEAGADRGLDLVAYEDPLGARGTRIKVQVKRYSAAPVAADVVERTASKLNDNETGVIVTLSSFTKEARLSARDSKDRITLIDGARLIELWSQYYDRMPEEGRALLRLRKVSYLSLDE